jgi:hypothetical protein
MKRSSSSAACLKKSVETLDDIKVDTVRHIYEKYITLKNPRNVRESIRNRIMSTIVTKRLYRRMDIDAVLMAERKANPDLSNSFFDGLVNQIFKA